MAFKFNFMSTLGGLAGGYASTFVEDWLKSDSATESETSYTTEIVEAVAGSAISAFVKNDLVKGIGSGMVGVAGYNLGKKLTSTSSTSGLGALLPSQSAVGQSAVGRIPFRSRRRSTVGSTDESKQPQSVG